MLSRLTSYVPQADVLLPSLSVAECLLYSALLRLGPDVPLQELRTRMLATLQELGLLHVADSLVGGSASVRWGAEGEGGQMCVVHGWSWGGCGGLTAAVVGLL